MDALVCDRWQTTNRGHRPTCSPICGGPATWPTATTPSRWTSTRWPRAAHVSRYHFARSFAATYGETPMRYLTRRRIERAQDLLRSANLTVTEVCMLVGFSSLGSFSSRFRELVGESPTEYRDRWAAQRRAAHPRLLPVHARHRHLAGGRPEQPRRSTTARRSVPWTP